MPLIEQAKVAHQAGELEAAERLYSQVLESDPDDADAHHLLGALLLVRHGLVQADTAQKHIKRAIVLRPAEPRFRHSLGKVMEARQEWQAAIDSYTLASEKEPFNVQYRMSLVKPLTRLKRFARVFEVCKGVLALEPNHPEANYKAASALRQLRREQDAAMYYRRHLETRPGDEQALFWIAILTGAPVAAAPASHVKSLFDYYADTFEAHLVTALRYETPQTLMKSLLELNVAAGPGRHSATWQHCIDLGCGTGLFGALVRPHVSGQLDGVDLSPKMIEKARLKAVYDHLDVGDIVDACRRCSADGARPRYDLLVAADVFVYLGDLAPILRAAHCAAAPAAVLSFSTERAGNDVDTFKATLTGRFVHCTEYVRDAASTAGWTFQRCDQCVIRCNAGRPITGDIFVFIRRDT